MKTIFITDKTTNLCSALFKNENIFIIKDKKNLFGEINNCVENLLSAGLNIVYLTTSFNYKKLSQQFDKLLNTHRNNYIQLINIDSTLIGRNSITYRLLTSLNIDDVISKYRLNSNLIIKKDFSQSLNLSLAFN